MALHRLFWCAGLAGGTLLASAACRENLSPARGPAAVVTVSPDSATVVAGDSVRLSATALNAAGSVIAGVSMAWSSTDTLVARVRQDGTALGLSPGVALIRATADGRTGEARLVVVVRVAGIGIAPSALTLVPGARYSLAAYAVDSVGSQLSRVTPTWTVTDSTVATVTDSGQVAAIGEGTAWVRAEREGMADSVLVRSARVRFTSVAAGSDLNTCAAGPDGAFCWGAEYGSGALGTGVALWEQTTPAGVLGGQTLMQVSLGEGFACGLTAGGSAYCWGSSAYGRLGNGASEAVVPRAVGVAGGPTLTTLRAGRRHACGVSVGGQIRCWGGNTTGALGVPIGTGTSAVPVTVAAPVPFVYVGTGYLHSCALATDGTAWCWGRGAQLGDSVGVARWEPGQVAGSQRFTQLSSGWNHTCGLTADSLVYCWGFNTVGQSGVAGVDPVLVPTAVQDSPRLASITAGYLATCGLTASGEVWCFGWNQGGSLGTGDTVTTPTPRPAVPGYHFTSVSVGNQHTCGTSLDGLVYCWGTAEQGALGDGSSGGMRTTPVPVLGQRAAGLP